MEQPSIKSKMERALGSLISSAGWTKGLLQVKTIPDNHPGYTITDWTALMVRRIAHVRGYGNERLHYRIESSEEKGGLWVARINTGHQCGGCSERVWNYSPERHLCKGDDE